MAPVCDLGRAPFLDTTKSSRYIEGAVACVTDMSCYPYIRSKDLNMLSSYLLVMIPDEELLDDLAAVATQVDGVVTQEAYDRKGSYSSRTLIERFGGWTDAKKRVGVNRDGVTDRTPTEELLNDLQETSERVDDVLTQEEYAELGSFSPTTMKNRFGSWSEAKERAGIMTSQKATVDELVEELNKGKTLREVADTFGYQSISSVSRKVSDNGYELRNKLSRQSGNGRTLSVTSDDLEEAGFDSDQELYFEKEVEDGEITLKLHTDRVAEGDSL